MRVACVLIHNFAVQLVRKDKPELRGLPVIIGGHPFQAKVVFDASPEAIACGVKVGMPLPEAGSLCPEGTFVQADDVSYEDVFGHLLSTLDDFSPTVETSGLGCAYLDLSGITREEEIAYEIKGGISSQTGLDACVGISGGKFLSWAAAFSGKPGAPVIVPEGNEREFIAPFSITLLPCSPQTIERLKLFGIHMIGELVRFSKDVLTAQFGTEGIMLYELAHGIDSSPLVPRKKPQIVYGVAELDPPATTHFEMLRACEVTLDELVSQAKGKGKACREIGLRLRFPSGATAEKRLPLKEATCSRESLLIRLRTWLEMQNLPEPLSEIELSLILGPESGKKVTLWSEGGEMKRELVRLGTELKVRFGHQPLKKALMTDPHSLLPEDRFRLIELE